jgi:hypothetical protein
VQMGLNCSVLFTDPLCGDAKWRPTRKRTSLFCHHKTRVWATRPRERSLVVLRFYSPIDMESRHFFTSGRVWSCPIIAPLSQTESLYRELVSEPREP